MHKLMLILSVVLGAAVPSRSQSASDLKAKYPAIAAYEIRPGIMLAPSYTSEGQVCEVVFERHTINITTKTTVNLDSFLTKETVKELVDELAPPSVRGKELTGLDAWLGSVTIDGPFVVTRHSYENVLVEVDGINRDPGSSGDLVVIIKWRKRVCAAAEQPATAAAKSKQQNGTDEKHGNSHTDTATKASTKVNR
jgi:hypothetical protein